MCVPATSPNAQRDDARVVRRNAYARSVGKLSLSHYETSIFPRGDRRTGMVSQRQHQCDELRDKGVMIWNQNAEDYDPEHKRDVGTAYGFSWRHRAHYQGYQQLRRGRSGSSRVRHSEYQRRSSLAPLMSFPHGTPVPPRYFHPVTYSTNSTCKITNSLVKCTNDRQICS